MDLKLTRNKFCSDGVFGELHTMSGQFIAVTLEHSYDDVPKLPPGSYVCERGQHKLHGMEKSFEAFEVKDVPGHSGILFHVGNYNENSDGCILLGKGLGKKLSGGMMIMDSQKTFDAFMALQKDFTFNLIVE